MDIFGDIISGIKRAGKFGNIAMVLVIVAGFLAYANSNLPGGAAVGRFIGVR